MTLQRNGLYSLRGLENLTRVAALELADNASLIDAGALNRLGSVRSLVIERNPLSCSWFGLLRGLTHSEQLSLVGNVGLDKATLNRFQKPNSQVSIATR